MRTVTVSPAILLLPAVLLLTATAAAGQVFESVGVRALGMEIGRASCRERV